MVPHPDFVQTDWPRHLTFGSVQLTPLSPEYVDEDFDAVVAAAPLLDGIFGDWPAGLTRASNLIDLAWHEREFTARRSFSWIIRDLSGTYMGCFYLFPRIGTRGQADAALWLCDIADRVGVAQDIKAALDGWLAQNLPPEITVTWNIRPRLE